MSTTIQVFVVLLGLVYSVQAAAVDRNIDWELIMGNCPKMQPANVLLKELDGIWYVQRYVNDGGFEVACATDKFVVDDSGLSAAVNSSYYIKGNTELGYIETNWDELAKGEFIYHITQFPLFLVKVTALVYEKDVGAVLSTCLLEAVDEIHLQVITKEVKPDNAVIDRLLVAAAAAGAEVDKLKSVSHTNCHAKVESSKN